MKTKREILLDFAKRSTCGGRFVMNVHMELTV